MVDCDSVPNSKIMKFENAFSEKNDENPSEKSGKILSFSDDTKNQGESAASK